MKEYQSNYTRLVDYEGVHALSLGQDEAELLRTPKGHVVKHANKEFIKHVISELEQFPVLKTEAGALLDEQLGYVTSYSLYSGLMDFVQDALPPDLDDVKDTLSQDLILHASAGPEQTDQYRAWEPIAKYLASIGIPDNWSVFSLGFRSNSHGFDLEEDEDGDSDFISFDQLSAIIQPEWLALTKPQRVVINVLVTIFSSLLAALCFVKGRCSASEYAHAVLAGSPAFHIFGDADGDVDPHETHREAYKEAVEVAKSCSEFLGYLDASRIDLEQLLRAGEGKNVEFKSTLRWNIKAKRNDEDITHASIKTIAAFLNTDGGTLFIGVNDEGRPLGLSFDGFQNDDKFMLHLMNVVKQQLGQGVAPYVDPSIHLLEGKTVCVVECAPSEDFVFLKSKKNPDGEFFVRTGPGTIKLSAEEMLKYIRRHFNNQ